MIYYVSNLIFYNINRNTVTLTVKHKNNHYFAEKLIFLKDIKSFSMV